MSTKSAPQAETQTEEAVQEEVSLEETIEVDAKTASESAETTSESAETTSESETQDIEIEEQNNAEESSEEAGDTVEPEKPVDPLVELQEKIKEQEDKYLRLVAEFDNFKRRNQQEVKAKLKFAGQALAQDIVPGLDNLERAIDHALDDANEQMVEFVKGIEMAQQIFYDALKKKQYRAHFSKGRPL